MVADVYGRDAELATIGEFLRAVPTGPRALVVEGEPGIGKTTIVRAALESATELRVLSAGPVAGEMELPYAALGDLLENVAPAAIAPLDRPKRVALETALARAAAPAGVDEHALARGLLDLLRGLAAEGELVLAVDDAQWLDRPTVSALTFALRRLADVAMRVLVATRAPPRGSGELPLGLTAWPHVRRLPVGPLSATELGAVIARRIGVRLARPRLEEVASACGGNPMFALELARRGPDRPVASLPLAVEARLSELDDRVRRVLAFAAAALRPSVTLLLGAGVERADLTRALESRVIHLAGDRIEFAHPLFATVTYESLLPDERHELHERLARASDGPIERGHHLSLSRTGRDDEAAAALDAAAAEAARLGDHAGAAHFLLRAAELSADRGGEREARAASELETAGDVEEAAALVGGLVARLGPGVVRAKARQTLVSCRLGSSLPYEAAQRELLLALEDARGDPAAAAMLRIDLGSMATGRCRLEEALQHLRVAERLAGEAGAAHILAAARAELGFTECMLGHGVTESALKAFETWDGTVLWPDSYTPRMALGCARLHATEFAEAERLFVAELRFAQARGLEAIEVSARAHLAECQVRAGHWPQALANARLAVEHARQATNTQVLTGASYGLAAVEALRGNHAPARARAAAALADAAATDDFWFVVSHRSVLGLVALAEDDPQAAIAALEPAWALMLDRGLGDLSIFPVAQVLGEALAGVGRTDDARAVARRVRECPVGARPWCRAMAGRCDALAAAAEGDHAAARRALAAALAAHAELPEPFEHARALHVAGRVHRSARAWGAARADLAEALDRYEALGAACWADRARADLDRLPGRRPSRRFGLTLREREVARLVANGLANREVAERLFISRRTVEANLSKVYAKLGVRSRTELASRLGRMDVDSTD
jgi:DNA-binding CsgD family transcriptional regulator